MSNSSRENHYVPQWYQEGFFDQGKTQLAYLDLTPPTFRRSDGSTVSGNSRFTSPTSRCFKQRDLYSTFFFGGLVVDEIERKLFGDIDTRGARAVKAYIGADPAECHRHFENLFSYIDIQKTRTPKGLDWLRAQYPDLSQNELMWEMQGTRQMHCTIWTEGVREIVSAQDSDVKFIVTDNPVTVYNPAIEPRAVGDTLDHDPSIALKGSQTVFPLNQDFCLILTNLENARTPTATPLDKRTFARNFGTSLVRTDTFIRTRKLAGPEVSAINAILKRRARRYIAAGREEWLHPEQQAPRGWRELGAILRPPTDGLWSFGGEIFAKMEDGSVHFQDEFGRTEKAYEALQKTPPKKLRGSDACGCGSNIAYRFCCQARPEARRPSWTELSIRERNLALYRATIDILDMGPGRTWTDVRQDLTDDRISRLYGVFTAFWPLETDLLQLLPKPDGRPRAVYSGAIHPELINEFAVGAGLYFGELLIEHPFVHAGAMRKEFSPVDNPQIYRQEILKAVALLVGLMPLIDCGLVNLVPDPCNFNLHLRHQMMQMARARAAGRDIEIDENDRTYKTMEKDARRSFLLMPQEVLEAQLASGIPGLEGVDAAELREGLEALKRADPLVSLQAGALASGKDGGLLSMAKLAPNFEMAMYLAQATGSAIVTDAAYRWTEIGDALMRRGVDPQGGLRGLAKRIEQANFGFVQDALEAVRSYFDGAFSAYPPLMQDAFGYLLDREKRGAKPNYEDGLAARFSNGHARTQATLAKAGTNLASGLIKVAMPARGIQDNTINRLLLMSSSEHHLASVPMAFFMAPAGTTPPEMA
ncbi:DUF4238 domain-containing protein [Caulobacter sp. UNC279MFTsu5.1]|uniref:DUF4238 domain-containing protein n=1 Tax=Caulobacter sp. UNC279MFTsu5.1 TaxID=1502775 RepID=UPI0008E2BC22|nr:DUF4238 domain-containing protein [Caulobacter sp. UNC279MFTsu5.1]SFJ61767.1 hypothetical protein SAMN02799626_02189 [Caulobacter sp. UNC279MFTsu5.1]